MNRLKTTVWIILITVFQAVFAKYISIAEIKPDLIFVFVLCIAAREKNIKTVMKIAVICGIAADCLTGRIFGNYLSVYLICSVIMFIILDGLFKGNMIVSFVLMFLLTILGDSLFYVINISVLKDAGYLYSLLNIILPAAFYNTILSFAVMYLTGKTIYKKAGVKF